MQTVSYYIMQALHNSGVDVIFGYPGQSNILLLDAARDVGIRYVQTADERGAGYAAAGYIQAVGKPTVVCTSKGPAATNLLTPLVSANKDGIPLMAITGNGHAELYGRNSFQDFNPSQAFEAAGAVKSACYVNDAGRIPSALTELFTTSWSEPYGPVLLDIADSLLSHSLGAVPHAIPMVDRAQTLYQQSGWSDIEKAALSIEHSQRPVVIVGRGARQDYARIREFTSTYHLPVVHTMGGTGVMSTCDHLYGGFLRHNGNREASYLVQNADVVLILGSGLDERATGEAQSFANHAVKIHVDLDATVLGRNVFTPIAIHASIVGFLSAIETLLPKDLNHSEWTESFLQWKQAHPLRVHRQGALTSLEFAEATTQAVPNAVVVKDSGLHKYWVTKFRSCTLPHHSIASCHFGTMGYGLPAAIGASIACPDETVVAICGDGGLLMSLADLPTAMREQCHNLKIVVFNNGGLGSTRDFEKRLGRNEAFISDFDHAIPFEQYAKSANIRGYTIGQRNHSRYLYRFLKNDLKFFKHMLKKDGLMLFNCIIDSGETMQCSIPYSHSLNDLL